MIEKEKQQQLITLYQNGQAIKDISNILNICENTVRSYLQKIGILTPKQKELKEETKIKIEEGIKLYQNGTPLLRISETLDINYEILRKELIKRNLIRSNKINSRKFQINHNFFEKIETESQAYWLGFIYADGYITQSKYGKYFGIALKSSDVGHLEKFKKDINSTYTIKSYINKSFGIKSNYVRHLASSDKIFDDLQKLGCVKRKSLILKFPNESQVPIYLQHHFIRGYFDGDGSFSKNGVGGYAIKICGTKEILNKLQEIFNCPHLKLSKRKKDNKNNFCLDISGKRQVIRLSNYIYKDATIYLERKYNRYLEITN